MTERIPESITSKEDLKSIKVSNIKFFAEDIARLQKMSDDDAIKYKAKLIDAGKYTIEWRQP